MIKKPRDPAVGFGIAFIYATVWPTAGTADWVGMFCLFLVGWFGYDVLKWIYKEGLFK